MQHQSVSNFDDRATYQQSVPNLGQHAFLSQQDQNSRLQSIEELLANSHNELIHAVAIGNETVPQTHWQEQSDVPTPSRQFKQPGEDGNKGERIQKMRQELKKIFNEDLDEELNVR